MRRVLSLYLPWWSAERAGRRLGLAGPLRGRESGPPRRGEPPRGGPPEAVVLVRVRAGQQIVAGVDEVGATAGVRAGLSLAHARTMLAGVKVHAADHDEVGDTRALTALARWAGKRWAPIASADPPDGILLDISGCAHLFGGEEGLLAAVERGVRRLGLTPRGAIASTVGAAWALARFAEGEDCIAWHGTQRRAMAPLPTAALRIDAETVESLAEVGIERVGQLFDVPRGALPGRYGAELLRRVDQALGLIPEMVDRVGEAIEIQASRELPGGTTRLDAIERVVQMLLTQVSASLEARESGLRRLDATFVRMNAQTQGMSVEVSRPTRDGRHLWSLLRPKVERLHMGFGVERVTLKVGGIARLVHRQVSLAGERENAWRHDGEFAAMLDTMASRLGRDRVLRADLVESHRPERACRLVAFDEAGRTTRGRDGGSDSLAPGVVGVRPSRLIEPPCAVEILALHPDGPVRRVLWEGKDHAIVSSIGPERIGPEWWIGREATRDYFRVQDEGGRWLWLFREADGGRWFVHGEWC